MQQKWQIQQFEVFSGFFSEEKGALDAYWIQGMALSHEVWDFSRTDRTEVIADTRFPKHFKSAFIYLLLFIYKYFFWQVNFSPRGEVQG